MKVEKIEEQLKKQFKINNDWDLKVIIDMNVEQSKLKQPTLIGWEWIKRL